MMGLKQGLSFALITLGIAFALGNAPPNLNFNNTGPALNYTINKLWNSLDPSDNATIHLKFYSTNSTDNSTLLPPGLVIDISAPFYNDPIVPPELPINSTDELWNYEVVEVFFLSETAQLYLETEFAPKGHYLVLELNTDRNFTKYELPLDYYETVIDEDNQMWYGRAVIPLDYLPEDVNKFNAYAIHKSDPDRVYMSLFPAPFGEHEEPNFHRLEYFQNINLTDIIEFPNKIVKMNKI